MTATSDPNELAFALRVLVHAARGALAGIRPVIASLLAQDASPPPAEDAVAQLNAVERVLNGVAAVYRRRASLREELGPAELEALLQAVQQLPEAGAALPAQPLAGWHEELELALRVLVHEVGNALTSVKPLVDILRRNPAYLWRLPPEERATSARLALARLDDTAQVLAQIGDLRPRLAAVALAEVVAAVTQEAAGGLAATANPAEGRGVALAVDCPAGLYVWADPLWLRHSLRNLVDNAARAAPPGTCVTITGRLRESCVALSVSDEGPGLSRDELDFIFHANLDARTAIRRPLAFNGAGIGLSLVRYWMRSMGATIKASSERTPPSGTVVTLLLPCAPGEGGVS